MIDLTRSNIAEARLLSHVFRYIDDITIINDNLYFINHFNKIYPPELELKLVNPNPLAANVLDIKIEITNLNKFKANRLAWIDWKISNKLL